MPRLSYWRPGDERHLLLEWPAMQPIKERFVHCVLRLIQCRCVCGRVTCFCSLLHLRSGPCSIF